MKTEEDRSVEYHNKLDFYMMQRLEHFMANYIDLSIREKEDLMTKFIERMLTDD